MTRSAIDQIELNIEKSKSIIKFGEALDRLKQNKDFQLVILTGYLDREPVRLVHLKADINMQKPELQAELVKQMDGIGSFAHYLNLVRYQTEQAQRSLEGDEETRNELMAEGLEA